MTSRTPAAPKASDPHFVLRFMDDEAVEHEADFDETQLVLVPWEQRISISLSGAQLDTIRGLRTVTNRIIERKPNASDIERAITLSSYSDYGERRDAIAAALAAARQEERAKTGMVKIEQFFPKGTQLRSPGGFSFDLKLVAGLSAKDEPDGYLDVFLPEGKVRCTFHRNSHDGSPPAIYQIKRNIEAAIREAK